MSAELAIVVLAAGKGTRLKSERAKVLHEAGGLPLLAHVLRAVAPLARRRRGPAAGVWVVVGHQADAVRQIAEAFSARTVLQRPQLGTGHAVAQAVAALPRGITRLLVLPGDAPLIRSDSLQALLRAQADSGAAALLTARLEDPRGYGRILRSSSGTVAAIVEQNALRPDQAGLREVNAGVYVFERARVAPWLGRLGRDNPHREYYLTDLISLLAGAGEKVTAHLTGDPDEVLGVNTPAELARVDALLRRRKAEALMSGGVTLYQPETQTIDPDVTIGSDTIVEHGVELRGATRVGRRCRLGAYSILHNAVLADDVVVHRQTVVLDSRLGAGAVVGPFAHLHDGADIRAGARIGNYVEVKNSVVREGAKAKHLTYLGDASVGRKSNIGAGTITCNYDGFTKNRTAIGDGAFIGSGSQLLAPVKVGKGAYVAAGSTINQNVPGDALAIARGRQVNKPGWVPARRRKLAAARGQKKGSRARALRTAAGSRKRKARRRRAGRRR